MRVKELFILQMQNVGPRLLYLLGEECMSPFQQGPSMTTVWKMGYFRGEKIPSQSSLRCGTIS